MSARDEPRPPRWLMIVVGLALLSLAALGFLIFAQGLLSLGRMVALAVEHVR